MKTNLFLLLGIVAVLLTACSSQVNEADNLDRVVVEEDRAARDTDTVVNVYEDDDDGIIVENTTVYVPVDDDDNTIIISDDSDVDVVWYPGEQETNEEIAREFVEGTATYRADGSDLELESSEKLSTNPPLLVYEFSYISEGEGYGDRDSVVGDETEHSVRVIIMNGEIVSAINDGIWNELTRRPVTQSGARAQGETCGDESCAEDLYCFRTSDGSNADGICIEES